MKSSRTIATCENQFYMLIAQDFAARQGAFITAQTMKYQRRSHMNAVYSAKAGDVVSQVIIIKLLNRIFNILPVLLGQQKIQTHWVCTSVSK
jgi:hypothetical protein